MKTHFQLISRCHWANDCSPDFGKRLSGWDHRGGDPHRPEDHQIHKSLGSKFIPPDSFVWLQLIMGYYCVGCSSCQYRRVWNASSRFVILLWFARTWGSRLISDIICKEIDRKTFLEMWDLSRPGGDAEECFLRLNQTELFDMRIPRPNLIETMPNVSLQERACRWFVGYNHKCRKFKELSEQDLFRNAVSGFTFDTVTIDVPKYLNYLLARFLEKGGNVIRGCVQHIDQVLEAGSVPFKKGVSTEGSTGPDAVVVCVGLGARFLGGVEDKTVYPSRGQTVILHAPWVCSGWTLEAAGEWTYIIPRRSGSVVVGGTLGVDDWKVLSGTTSCWEILNRCLQVSQISSRNNSWHPQTRAGSLSGTCTARCASIKNTNGRRYLADHNRRSLWLETHAKGWSQDRVGTFECT